MPPAAIIGGSMLLGAGASVYSGNKAAKAAKSAANTAASTELQMFEQNRADLAPYRQIGTGAMNKLASLYGIDQYTPPPPDPVQAANPPGSLGAAFQSTMLAQGGRPSLANAARSAVGRAAFSANDPRMMPTDGGRPASGAQALAGMGKPTMIPEGTQSQMQGANIPAAQGPDYSDFYNSPDYQFAMQQGERTVNQNLARQGLTGSGEALKALTRFGQGMASQQLGNYKNSLAALAGIGQTSTNTTAQLGANAASNIGQSQMNAGDARASSYLNTGSAISGLANMGAQYGMLKGMGAFG